MQKSKLLAFMASSVIALNAHSSIVAVMDSGTDIEHKDLKPIIWSNPLEANAKSVAGIDDDLNGLVDDLNGFNFYDFNGVLLDRTHIDAYSMNIEKMYRFQYIYELYEAGYNYFTKEMIDWYNNIIKDQAFMNKSAAYGGYSHGTHVSGIVAKNNPNLELMPFKVLSDNGAQLVNRLSAKLVQLEEQVGFGTVLKDGESEQAQEYNEISEEFFAEIIAFFKNDAVNFASSIKNVSIYAGQKGARAVNASLGTDIKMIFRYMTQVFEPYNLSNEDIAGLSFIYMDAVIAAQKSAIEKSSPNTLFVIAAGNSNSDNDALPVAPANIRSNNAITVAATLDRVATASFTNYGAKTVDIAAPGVGAYSTVPGDNYLFMNGTSQAAPFVTRIVSLVIDANPELTPAEVKQILMGTVDKKDFLKGKVVSEGIVNEARAVYAAELTSEISIEMAIASANLNVDDVVTAEIFSKSIDFAVEPPSEFAFKVAPLPGL